MRAVFFSIGTRGDAEPFLALAEVLKNHGWEVTCVFPEQFRDMVEQASISFHGFDKQFLELLESQTGKTLMGGSGGLIRKIKAMRSLARSSWKLQDQLIVTQKQCIRELQPDKIFYHPKCVYPILWEMAHPGSTILVCPIPCVVHEVKEYSTIGLTGNGNFGPFLNKLSYKAVNWIRSLVFYRLLRKQKDHLNHIKVSAGSIYRTIVFDTKSFYSISPSLFPRPAYWPRHLYVTGFVERNKKMHWQPEETLQSFLSKHEKILLISFGSMKNEAPLEKTLALLRILKKYRIPTIINTSWGGLQKIENCPEYIYFVDNIPYDWILPKVYAMVHHGGSGTTHTACKYGCPSLIIPHIVDQYFWNRRIADLGLGPRGIAISRLTTSSVEKLLLDLWENPAYKKKAREIQQKMSSEGMSKDLLVMIGDEVKP